MINLNKLPVAFVMASSLGFAPALAQTTANSAPAEALNQARPAAELLAAGGQHKAVKQLEAQRKAAPHDPAVLINLGIAYARIGDDEQARAAFEQALASRDPVELDTADGKTTDSRRLARRALRMLERGEFRAGADQPQAGG